MTPYRIDVPAAVLDDLGARLARTRWADEIPGAGWKYGCSMQEVRALCEYWAIDYDWRAAEARLNEIPQFMERVDGVDIHFCHVRARQQPATPLLLLHGWPGSIFEFVNLIGPLTQPDMFDGGPAFDVVVPSMHGFGFSGKPRAEGWHADRVASAFHELMTRRLGYLQYGIQGDDWGTIVGSRMAHLFPESLIGLHINMPIAYPPSPNEAGAREFEALLLAETGYLHLQNTKPDAISMAQADSPAGLDRAPRAWLEPRFNIVSWTDTPSGGHFPALEQPQLLLEDVQRFFWMGGPAV